MFSVNIIWYMTSLSYGHLYILFMFVHVMYDVYIDAYEHTQYYYIPLWNCHTLSWDAFVPYNRLVHACLLHARLLHDCWSQWPLCNFNITMRAYKWTLYRSRYLIIINNPTSDIIDNFIEVYNTSVFELLQCFVISFFGRIDHLASSVIKLQRKKLGPKHCIRSITYDCLPITCVVITLFN